MALFESSIDKATLYIPNNKRANMSNWFPIYQQQKKESNIGVSLSPISFWKELGHL
jgi:hypothetical protein